jgi:hypothetical protein
MWAGESAFMVSLAVVAFRDGGVAAVGVVTAARMATAALLAPLLATMADRARRERVLTGIGVVRAAMLACAAVVTGTGGPPAATYGFAVVATGAVALYPAGAFGSAPRLGEVPGGSDERECGARDARVARHARRAGGRGRAPRGERTGHGLRRVLRGVAVGRASRRRAPVRRAAAGGSRARVHRPRHPPGLHDHRGRSHTLLLITTLGVVQTFTRGCLTVFAVVVAIDLLHTGDPGVGVLNAAVGAGGELGSFSAFALVRRGGLATWFGVGIALFGAPLSFPSRRRRSSCSAWSASATR